MLVLCRLLTSLGGGETKHEMIKNNFSSDLRCRRVEKIQVNRIETALSVIILYVLLPRQLSVRQTASLLFPVRDVQVFCPTLI